MTGDRIVWDRLTGGQAVVGPVRVSLPAVIPLDIGCAAWRGLSLESLHYEPGTRYRIRIHACEARDMQPAEMQCCADWLARLGRRFLATGEGV